ncbi:GNAT family N-acetyltransferase [Solitalea sp. MAHUQ-68]|uniref:GNAT family N-acetyltransferase n=1 Tax=Solitalea agri TaxID=2953739 RepID=A0A9X2EZW8_9SPHI|nr:GNAT family N-acetyltransferase [Solitalea agri]MCO4292032.1 GNAT family N-acetyltransferase [Solitalea agri]
MEYLIRSIEEWDLPELVILCQKHAEYERAVYQSAGKEELLRIALFSAIPKLFALVVESNNKVVGYSTYTFDFSTWDAALFLHMDCLYLESEFRSTGIGAVLIERLTHVAVDKGCVNIQWQTPIFNERAIKFYNRLEAIGKEKMRFSLELTQS